MQERFNERLMAMCNPSNAYGDVQSAGVRVVEVRTALV